MVAGRHEPTDTPDLQDPELARLQRGAEAARVADDLVRPCDDLGGRAHWQARAAAQLQPSYSDAAIQTCVTMKVLFGMALRQTTGFVESLLRLIGQDWAVAGLRHAVPPARRAAPGDRTGGVARAGARPVRGRRPAG